MAAKAFLAICATALFVQSALTQCLNHAPLAGIAPRAYDGYYSGCGCGNGLRAPLYDAPCGIGADIAAASSLNAAWGGGLHVSSASPVAPTGLSVASENVYEGALSIGGNVPFLGTVAVDGVFPTAGAGAISYGCGNGAVGITTEGTVSAIAPAAAITPAVGIAPAAGLAGPYGIGYRGYAGRADVGSCGCNTYNGVY